MARSETLFCAERFTVSGAGEFPIDMLRYDRAVPDEESDSSAITRDDGPARRIHLVRFAHRGARGPSVERWASFGWKVGP